MPRASGGEQPSSAARHYQPARKSTAPPTKRKIWSWREQAATNCARARMARGCSCEPPRRAVAALHEATGQAATPPARRKSAEDATESPPQRPAAAHCESCDSLHTAALWARRRGRMAAALAGHPWPHQRDKRRVPFQRRADVAVAAAQALAEDGTPAN